MQKLHQTTDVERMQHGITDITARGEGAKRLVATNMQDAEKRTQALEEATRIANDAVESAKAFGIDVTGRIWGIEEQCKHGKTALDQIILSG